MAANRKNKTFFGLRSLKKTKKQGHVSFDYVSDVDASYVGAPRTPPGVVHGPQKGTWDMLSIF